jgi:hypothetical protein
LYALGLLSEGRDSALRIEMLRLLLVMPILWLVFQQTHVDMPQSAWGLLAVYSLVSAGWLLLISVRSPQSWKSADEPS